MKTSIQSVMVVCSFWISFAASAGPAVSTKATPTKIVVSKPIPKNLPPLKEAGKILVVLSEQSTLTLTNKKTVPTGYYFNELIVPAMTLSQAGYSIVFATPTGKAPTMDKRSDSVKFFASPAQYKAAKAALKSFFSIKTPLSFKAVLQVGLTQYQGIFVPGGHAPITDLYRDPMLGKILTSFHASKKPTGLICHGPAALLSTITVDTQKKMVWPYQGYQMTAFSTMEEKTAEKNLGGSVPFYVDAELGKLGAKLLSGVPGKSNVVRDRELITGQNPASDRQFADAFLKAVQNK